MSENVKIVKEVAEQEFNRFVEAMDLDVDPAFMDEDDLNNFNKQKSKIIRAIMRGNLIFNEGGEAVYTPCNPSTKYEESLTFHERTGASLMAMDNKKKGHDVSKTYAVMASMCKVHQSVFASMAGNDIKTCEAIFALLMD